MNTTDNTPSSAGRTDNWQNYSFRHLWNDYKPEALFLLVLSACVAVGHVLAYFIPLRFITDILLPVQHGANIAVCMVGAWLLFRHSDGLRIRKACAYVLVVWGLANAGLLTQDYVFHLPVLRIGSAALNAYMLFVCNFLGWILLVYPTETLRPGWLNVKRAMSQLLPLVALVVLDYCVPVDLRVIISMYPVVLFVLVITHLHAYKVWCEENYSSMEHIDVQWIVRYLLMVLVLGLSYLYVAVSDNPGRVVTQNALLFFMFAYSIEQILFRRDPWSNVRGEDVRDTEEIQDEEAQDEEARSTKVTYAQRDELEHWLEAEKPYLNPDFKLMDMRAVLPINRTYLSQFINDTYGCSFYQFVNKYRIEEAKRQMQDHPDWKMADVAAQSGFSSQAVFSQVFSKETGMSPREWRKTACPKEDI